MGTVQSNSEVAGQCATSLYQARTLIMGYSDASKDSDTTLAGNSTASGKIDTEMSLISQVANGVQTFSDKIKKIDKSFVNTDSNIASTMTDVEGWSLDNAKAHTTQATKSSSGKNGDGQTKAPTSSQSSSSSQTASQDSSRFQSKK